ncbi:hypothetical protein D3C71_1633970 [compost metagenome]
MPPRALMEPATGRLWSALMNKRPSPSAIPSAGASAAAGNRGDSTTPPVAVSSGNTCANNGANRARRAAAACVSFKLMVIPSVGNAAAGCSCGAGLVHKAGWALRKRVPNKESTGGRGSAFVMARSSRKVLPTFFARHVPITNHLY